MEDPETMVQDLDYHSIWIKVNLDDVQENVQSPDADREGALVVVLRVDRDVRGSPVQNADVQDQEGGRIQLLREATRGRIRGARGRDVVRGWL